MSDVYENAMRQALGMNPLTADDVTEEYTDVGNQKRIPVFSDKEQKQGRLWDQMNRANGPAYLDATKNYYESLADPNLPINQRSARYETQDAQAGVDATAIARAISNRQQVGRKR